jgi:hypothetical protein
VPFVALISVFRTFKVIFLQKGASLNGEFRMMLIDYSAKSKPSAILTLPGSRSKIRGAVLIKFAMKAEDGCLALLPGFPDPAFGWR